VSHGVQKLMHPHQHPPVVTVKKNFYRQHTFAVKGPDRRETRDYMRSLEIFLEMPEGSQPLTSEQIKAYFAAERKRRADAAKQ